MLNDIVTIIWKEWKELIGRSTKSRSDTIKTLVLLAFIASVMVWRASVFVLNPGSIAVPSFILVQFVIVIMADSFAGERERHTLETLLASRLSDLAILIGKIAAGVLLAWGLMVFVMGLGILTAYARHEGDQVPLPVGHIAAMLLIYLLLCLTVSCAAVLVSLRAA